MPAKAKAVGENATDGERTRSRCAIIQVALGILILDIDGRRNDLIEQGEHAHHELDTSGGTQQVPQLALRAGDAEFFGVGFEHAFHGDSFCLVAQRCTGAVCIHVIDVGGGDASSELKRI